MLISLPSLFFLTSDPAFTLSDSAPRKAGPALIASRPRVVLFFIGDPLASSIGITLPEYPTGASGEGYSNRREFRFDFRPLAPYTAEPRPPPGLTVCGVSNHPAIRSFARDAVLT